MIKQIILNIIANTIGHQPNRDELKSCFDYVADAYTDKFTTQHAEMEIINWRNDTLRRCSECGEWFLPEHTIDYRGSWICENPDCRKGADEGDYRTGNALTTADVL